MKRKQSMIGTDPETLKKLKAIAPGGNVSALLREIANGNKDIGELTHQDLANQIGASQSAILEALGRLGQGRKGE